MGMGNWEWNAQKVNCRVQCSAVVVGSRERRPRTGSGDEIERNTRALCVFASLSPIFSYTPIEQNL